MLNVTIPVTQTLFISISECEDEKELTELVNAALEKNSGWVFLGIDEGTALIGKPL